MEPKWSPLFSGCCWRLATSGHIEFRSYLFCPLLVSNIFLFFLMVCNTFLIAPHTLRDTGGFAPQNCYHRFQGLYFRFKTFLDPILPPKAEHQQYTVHGPCMRQTTAKRTSACSPQERRLLGRCIRDGAKEIAKYLVEEADFSTPFCPITSCQRTAALNPAVRTRVSDEIHERLITGFDRVWNQKSCGWLSLTQL